MSRPRIGSLCSGYGGLDLAVEHFFGAETAWFCEYDDAPSRILAHHWPDVPNHRDITAVDWSQVEPIDILTAGYPCQPFSHAGKRKGKNDERHIWPDVARAISELRPRVVVLENVRGHVSLGLDAVIGDLSSLGYDARWGVVRAADAGAAHGRARIFIVATDTQDDGRGAGLTWGRSAKQSRAAGGGVPTTDARLGQQPRPAVGVDGLRLAAERGGEPASDAEGNGRDEGRAESARIVGRPDAAECGASPSADADRDGLTGQSGIHAGRQAVRAGDYDADRCGMEVDWGVYTAAITRWAGIIGRPAPAPTEPGRNGNPRLSPAFVEWLMGLPDGHVTDPAIGLTRNQQLKALGNGVVPQQAVLALGVLV